jgi:Tol biopolymer transport system component
VQLLDTATGSFSYTPNAGVTGYDTFTFEATDGQLTVTGTQMVFIVAAVPQWPGQTTRVSVASDGMQGNSSSVEPTLSADGRYVAFASNAPLVTGDTNDVSDVFVHDRATGAIARVSVTSSGAQADGMSSVPAITPDGRYVAFESQSLNLAPGGTFGNTRVFIHDRVTGQTTVVSTGIGGAAPTADSRRAQVSADGRFIAYDSGASNLVAGDVNGARDVFVFDRTIAATILVSTAADGSQANGSSSLSRISADGRYIAFQSDASTLVPGDTNGRTDVFVHDRQTGETWRVSVASDGTEGNGSSSQPSLSADGRYIAFQSNASTLVPGDTNGGTDVFVHDRQTGETRRVSVASDGTEGNGSSIQSSLSADGRYIAFSSGANALVPGDTNGALDVFVYDRQTGGMTRVSVGSAGAEGDGNSQVPTLSADGRFIAFSSVASNLVPGDTNAASDVFVVGGVVAAPPTAEEGTVSTSEDVPVNGTLIASDPSGAALTFTLLSTGTLGTAVLTDPTTGAFTYTPNPDAHGTDTFTFSANNGALDSNVATVTVTITPVNDAPVASDDTLATSEDVPASGTLSATDVDGPALTFSLVSNGSLGTAAITNAGTGAYTYTPNPNAFGTDTFTFRATDGILLSNVATITVTIAAVNDAPVAQDGTLAVTAGASAGGTLVAMDIDGPALTYTLVANGTKGTATITDAATGAYTYTANAGTSGSDTFTFKADDGVLDSNVATVTVTIAPGNRAPEVLTGVVTTQQDAPVSGTFQASDPDGDALTFTITSAAALGSVQLLDAATGSFRYTPNAGLTGYDTFAFEVTDDQVTVSGTQMVFIVAAAPQWPGGTTRVSVASDGAEGNSQSLQPTLSADGRFVAFSSDASNLVSGDTNGTSDVFVHDRQTGETTLVSVTSDGTQANGSSFQPALSADGRYVAFSSDASNWAPACCLRSVFVHDRHTGETELVSVSGDGIRQNGDQPALSADGRYVAFSSGSALVAGDTNGTSDVFVYDRQTGKTTRVSVGSDGIEANSSSVQPALSADGRYVAFKSWASNLVVGDTNGITDVFVHDRQTGATTRVSVASDGTQGILNYMKEVDRFRERPVAISADGRFVAFYSLADNLVSGDTNLAADVFVHDRRTGETTRVSVASDGTQANDETAGPAISADGRYVAFSTWATTLVAGDTNDWDDVFVHDRQTGQTRRVTVASDGTQGDGYSLFPGLSADGRHVAVESLATNLVAGDTNGESDILVVGGVSVSPSESSSPASGGDGTVAVTFVYPGTTWTTTSNAPWITITNQSSTTGDGTASYSVAPNTGAERVGTLTVALQTVTITQQGAPVLVDQEPLVLTGAPSSAVYDTSFTVSTSGGSGTGEVTFAASDACSNTDGGAVITMTSGTGTCTIVATKSGDDHYNDATSAPASVLATKAAQATLTVIDAPATAELGTSFTVGSAGGSGTGAVIFSASGACTNTDGGALITMVASSGTCSITATKAADDNYEQTTSIAASVTATAPVAPAAPSALSASAVSANQIALAWTDNASSEDGFKIERSQTNRNNFVQVATAGPDVTSYTRCRPQPGDEVLLPGPCVCQRHFARLAILQHGGRDDAVSAQRADQPYRHGFVALADQPRVDGQVEQRARLQDRAIDRWCDLHPDRFRCGECDDVQ